MKKILQTIAFGACMLWLLPNSFGEVVSNQGVQFKKGTWKEMLSMAQKENKLIFLDVYATWCGPCKMLKNKTFPDKTLGDFFNLHFINYPVDAESKEGAEIAKKYKVDAYPTLLFIDGMGNVVSKKLGYHTPKELLDVGEKVIINHKKNKR